MDSILSKISQAVINGDATVTRELTQTALKEGVAPSAILREALALAMDEVGRRMEAGDYFLPEVLLSARAMKTASEILKPLLIQGKAEGSLGRVVIGTVEGDVHDIGKNIVAMMLEGAGFEVIDLGINVPSKQFLNKVQETKADILAMSALLTTTMGKMEEVIKDLKAAGCRKDIIVMVGGAPVNQEFASKIGADGFAPDAGGAARLARKLAKERVKSQNN